MRHLSFTKALKNDDSLTSSAIVAVVPGGIGVFGILFGWLPRRSGAGRVAVSSANAPLLFVGAGLFAIGGVSSLLRRWSELKRLCASGIEVPGRIASAWMERDRERTEFTYTYQGTEFRSGVAIHKTAATLALREGAKVQILIDPSKPTKAILPSLCSGATSLLIGRECRRRRLVRSNRSICPRREGGRRRAIDRCRS